MFGTLLSAFVILMTIVVVFGFINEKTVQLPTEIALLLGGLLISVVVIIQTIATGDVVGEPMAEFLLEDYLVDGVLCFMLFAGACRLRFCELRTQLKLISVLAIVSTILAAFIYGALAFGVATLLGLTQLTFAHCILLGCIISPTDPIAAMSILNKAGLPEDIALTIEGESLFNDGVGVALFIVVSGILSGTGGEVTVASFVGLIGKEIIGALVLGGIISLILYKLFVLTHDRFRQIFISLLAVSLSYVLCEKFGFSSAIAAVVCGISFATYMDKPEQANPEKFTTYREFWSVVDSLLNSSLYVLLGLTFVNLFAYAKYNFTWILIAIVCNVAARYSGMFVGSLIVKEKPQNLKLVPFTNLMTWAGLKGALCLALAMDTSSCLPDDAFQIVMICTFAVVMFTTLGQGLTIGKFYQKNYN